MKRNLFFVTGVSGSGKSTLCNQLVKKFGKRKDISVLEFDTLGVPGPDTSFKDWVMWRVERTKVLMELTSAKNVVICGTVLMNEFYKFNDYDEFKVKFCLLTLTEQKIKRRLVEGRNWDDDMAEDNIKTNSHLRWLMMREFDGLVLDTSKLTVKKCVTEISEWMFNKGN